MLKSVCLLAVLTCLGGELISAYSTFRLTCQLMYINDLCLFFAFIHTYSRLLTCEADKSIKIWKENENATEFTHPVDMDAWTKDCLKLKHY